MSETKLITHKKLGKIAKNVLDFLEEKKIDSVENLEEREMLGDSFDIKGSNHAVHIGLKSSNLRGEDYAISYVNPDGGIPIEIKINLVSNSSQIIAKANSKIKNYAFVKYDSFGNRIQNKVIVGCSIPSIKKELENLVS